MFRLISSFCLILITIVFAFPQSSDDYNKNEFFVGFSHQHVGNNVARRVFNGFNASYVRNINRFAGIKGDVSGSYNSSTVVFPLIINGNTSTIRRKDKRSLYNFLGGVQVKDNASENRLQPFAHALGGISHNIDKASSVCASGNCPGSQVFNRTFSDTGIAAAFGGGLDIKVNEKISVRALVDYNPVFSGERLDNNARFSFGIVFK